MLKNKIVTQMPSQWLPWGMALLGFGLLALGVASAIWLSGPGAQQVLAGEGFISTIPAEVEFNAPELNLQDLQGNPVALSDFRGNIVLVNNWAVWCPPCKAEMPALQAYYEAHREQDFVLIAIDAGDPKSKVIEFTEQYGLSFPVWLDARSEALAAFHNDALPSSYVIDRQGMVRYAWTGAINLPSLEKYITPMLEE
jgi:peroxiredoxin